MVIHLQRPSYFPGEFLATADYCAEQNYLDGLRHAHDAELHTWGIASGLAVRLDPVANAVLVAPGTAIDPSGELIVATEELSLGVPQHQHDALLIIRPVQEVIPPKRKDELPRVREGATVDWEPLDADRSSVALAAYVAGEQRLDSAVRRYVGLEVGALRLTHPQIARGDEPSVVGWAANGEYGLRIGGREVRFTTRNGDEATITTAGLLGVGTMNPKAALDVRAPTSPLIGPGRVSSSGRIVSGTDPAFSRVLAEGDTIFAVDRAGQAVQSTVVRMIGDDRVETAEPLHADRSPWEFRRALVARIASSKRELLSVDEVGRVGIGTRTPAARLTIAGGDLRLTGVSRTIELASDGRIESAGRAREIRFDPRARCLELRDGAAFNLVAGTGSPVEPAGLYISSSQNVGLGTKSPGNRLTVAGAIRSSEGFVFPDGSVQVTAQIAVPIGTVIDWFRADAAAEIPDSFQICNGATVEDPESPFFGYPLPNLTEQFIRGVVREEDIGRTGGSDLHLHEYEVPVHVHQFVHVHPDYSSVSGGADEAEGNADEAASQFSDSGHVHSFTASILSSQTSDTGPNSDYGGPPGSTERAPRVPPWFGLLKLIRIK